MLTLPIVLCDLGPSITLLGPVAHTIRPEEKAHGEPDSASIPAIRHSAQGFGSWTAGWTICMRASR